MIYNKTSFCRFMALTCLLGMASASGTRFGKQVDKWDSAPDLFGQGMQGKTRLKLRRNKSDPGIRSCQELRRAVSSANLLELANSREWQTVVLGAERKFIMFDLDQCVLHRANGADLTETRNGASAFVTYREAIRREKLFTAKWGKRYRTLVTSKLPVGRGIEEAPRSDEPEDATWLLVIFRPGLKKLIRHCLNKGWTIGVNTAMNPVHGQPIVDGFQRMFGIKIKPEHRYFRMSTVRDTDSTSGTYRQKNIKDYDKPTWLVRLDFNNDDDSDEEPAWYYQYMHSSGKWVNLRLYEDELAKFCPDVLEKGAEAIQDNMTPTYLSDELQTILDPENAGVYEWKMKESANNSGLAGWLLGGLSYLIRTGPKFEYPYNRQQPEVPIWENEIEEGDFPTIHERLGGESTCIVHFDDKAFDVRLPQHNDVGNRASLAWYPQSSLEGPKAKKVKTPEAYEEDMNNLMKLLC